MKKGLLIVGLFFGVISSESISSDYSYTQGWQNINPNDITPSTYTYNAMTITEERVFDNISSMLQGYRISRHLQNSNENMKQIVAAFDKANLIGKVMRSGIRIESILDLILLNFFDQIPLSSEDVNKAQYDIQLLQQLKEDVIFPCIDNLKIYLELGGVDGRRKILQILSIV